VVHLDREGLTTVGDIFPPLDLVKNVLYFGGEALAELVVLARVAGCTAHAKLGEAEQVLFHCAGLDGSAGDRLATGQMGRVNSGLHDGAAFCHSREAQVILELHIETKSEPVQTVGSKCPKVFGRLGGAARPGAAPPIARKPAATPEESKVRDLGGNSSKISVCCRKQKSVVPVRNEKECDR
jgi:hypothetical protein